jgi:hypothetical protein
MILSVLALALAVAFANAQNYGGASGGDSFPGKGNNYGGKMPPQDSPSNSYNNRILPPHDTPPKLPPSGNSYSGIVPPMDQPRPPTGNSYNGGIVPPMDQPRPPTGNSYNSGIVPPMDQPKPPTGKSYGGDIRIPPPFDTPTVTDIDSGACKTTDRWLGVVDCYDCELNRCARECRPELPKNFELCFNKTALFNLKTLFSDCLGSDFSKCHRLTDDMALAFLLAHYDQKILDINRRDECIFRCGRPRVMNCMNMCDQLTPDMDVQKEPIVLCYKNLESKIHDMLVDFATCLNQYQALSE